MSKPSALPHYSAADRALDQLLVLHVLSGRQCAVDRLGQRWQARLMRVALHITGDPELAEMAAQETWVAICRSWQRLKDPAKFSPWAFGILMRKCFDAVRRTSGQNARTVPLEIAPDACAPARAEMQIELNQAFDTLLADHRTVAILYFGEELTLAEIAAILDRPLGTIQSRIFHARKHLKATLSGEDL